MSRTRLPSNCSACGAATDDGRCTVCHKWQLECPVCGTRFASRMRAGQACSKACQNLRRKNGNSSGESDASTSDTKLVGASDTKKAKADGNTRGTKKRGRRVPKVSVFDAPQATYAARCPECQSVHCAEHRYVCEGKTDNGFPCGESMTFSPLGLCPKCCAGCHTRILVRTPDGEYVCPDCRRVVVTPAQAVEQEQREQVA